jgi:hypothetical protein
MEGLPVAYWPILNTNVDTPSFYVTGAQFRNDNIFGTQVLVDWDLYQIFGIDAVDGTKWGLSTDYLSKRGFALGTNFRYNLPSLHGGGPAYGYFDAWGLNDEGLDTLGSDRTGLVPEETSRGRMVLQHRQLLSPDQEFWAEFGYISDRNFLEQYFEQEWDTLKDRSTALRYRHYFLGQQMLDIWGQVRLNDFFTETQWLPRLDHYWLPFSSRLWAIASCLHSDGSSRCSEVPATALGAKILRHSSRHATRAFPTLGYRALQMGPVCLG